MQFNLPDLSAGWPWSLWFFVITAVVYLLQRFPLTGVFLMIVAAALWSVVLINLGMVGIAVEAVTGRVNPLWLAIPALYFGGYYWAYSNDQTMLARVGEEAVRFNAGKALPFDAERQDLLVVERGDGLGLGVRDLVERYGLPRVFSSDGRVYMVGSFETCKLIGDKPEFLSAGIQSNMITRPGARRFLKTATGFCMVMMPGKPDKPVVRITQQPTKGRRGWLPVDTTELIALDEAAGQTASVRTGIAAPLKRFPMPAMGCALNSGAGSWDCFAGFMRDSFTQIVPGMPRYSSGTSLLAKMLGLRQSDDLAAHAIGPERFKPIADRIDAELVAKEMAILERMLGNPTEYIRDGWLSHLPNRPDVIAPLAPRIFAALAVLQEADVKSSDTGRNLWRLVTKMSDETLAPYRERMIEWMMPHNERPWLVDEFMLYARLDARDPRQREILLHRLTSNKNSFVAELLPPFCRLGAGAPDDTKQRLLALWRQREPQPGNGRMAERDRIDAVLYLTLARMGLKAEAGKVEQRYHGSDFRDIWERVTPNTPDDICIGNVDQLRTYFREAGARP